MTIDTCIFDKDLDRPFENEGEMMFGILSSDWYEGESTETDILIRFDEGTSIADRQELLRLKKLLEEKPEISRWRIKIKTTVRSIKKKKWVTKTIPVLFVVEPDILKPINPRCSLRKTDVDAKKFDVYSFIGITIHKRTLENDDVFLTTMGHEIGHIIYYEKYGYQEVFTPKKYKEDVDHFRERSERFSDLVAMMFCHTIESFKKGMTDVVCGIYSKYALYSMTSDKDYYKVRLKQLLSDVEETFHRINQFDELILTTKLFDKLHIDYKGLSEWQFPDICDLSYIQRGET